MVAGDVQPWAHGCSDCLAVAEAKDADAGDWVSLRTGKGKNRSFVNDDGKTVHRFYWGLDHPVWNDDGDAAVLIEIADWKTRAAG